MLLTFCAVLLLGAYLATRFTAFVLIPVSCLVAGIALCWGAKGGGSIGATLLLFVGLPFALQAGYLIVSFAHLGLNAKRNAHARHV